MSDIKLKGKLFIFYMVPLWKGVWTRQNHFSIRLVKAGATVLYVEETPAVTSSIKKKKWKDVFHFRSSTYKTKEGVYVMKPSFQFPGSLSHNYIAKFNALRAATAIKKWMKNNGYNSCDTLWCRIPVSAFILNKIKHEKLVYDITDDYELYAKNERIREKTVERERTLVSKANDVFITSEELKQKETLRNIRTEYLPNGVEFDLFSSVDKENVEINKIVSQTAKPIIGYVGLISYWMDFELLELLGKQFPEHVIMVGPIAAQVSDKFKKIKGIKWIDLVPQSELPHYIKGFDVCIMPHQVNELRKRANPLKIWEYLATGKPFVSVDLPALKPAKDCIYIAKNHQEFIEMINNVLTKGEPEEFNKRRKDIAYNFSWDKIFNDLKSRLMQ